MNDREKAARAIGYLEGFSAWIWAQVGRKLADEYAACYDDQVEILRDEIFREEVRDEL